jgi:tRNA dimethylallyltransferase
VAAAADACSDIVARGRVPLFVGGTGLYLRGVLRGVFQGPPADWEFRRRLQAEPGGSAALYERLAGVDPAASQAIHPHDERRIVRALEVHHATGVPLSEQQRQSPLPPDLRPKHVDWLHPPRAWLYARIDARVADMIGRGLVGEVHGLLSRYTRLSRTARQALGYREVIEHLEGRRDLPETIALIQKRTRQFAKRQHTWFRNLEECTAVAMTGEESPWELAGRIAEGGR